MRTLWSSNVKCDDEYVSYFYLLWQNWRDLYIAYFLNMEGFWTLLLWRRQSFVDKLGLYLLKWQLLVMLSGRCKTFHFMISLWFVLLIPVGTLLHLFCNIRNHIEVDLLLFFSNMNSFAKKGKISVLCFYKQFLVCLSFFYQLLWLPSFDQSIY